MEGLLDKFAKEKETVLKKTEEQVCPADMKNTKWKIWISCSLQASKPAVWGSILQFLLPCERQWKSGTCLGKQTKCVHYQFLSTQRKIEVIWLGPEVQLKRNKEPEFWLGEIIHRW